MSREVREPSWIALRYMIEEKVRQIEIYRKHMESDDLGVTERDGYREIIEN